MKKDEPKRKRRGYGVRRSLTRSVPIALAIRLADVDLINSLLTLRRTKAGRVQHVPLNAEAKYLLERLQAVAKARAIATLARRSLWVFPSENPEQPIEPQQLLPTAMSQGREGR